MGTLGDYDFFGNQTRQLQLDMNKALPKAYKPIEVNGASGPGYTRKPEFTSGLGEYLGMGADLANIGLSGVQAYLGWENLGLAEDQFAFEKAAANRNIANQGKQVNNAYENASNVGLALGGGAMTPEQIAAEKAALRNRYVDTSAIG